MQRAAGQQALHAEEIRVEARRENHLVDDNLAGNGQGVRRGKVEVVAQEDEPAVVGDADEAADDEGAQPPRGLVAESRAFLV